MSNFKEEIQKALLEKRPNLSEKSLTSYISTLYNLPKKIKSELSIDFFYYKMNQILNYLKTKPPRSRKSILSPLVVLTDLEEYKTMMKSDIEEYNEDIKNQIKTPKENLNWIEWNEVLKINNDLKFYFNGGLKKNDMNNDLFKKMNEYVLLSFFVYFPPRRGMDYATMKFKNYDIHKNNYVDLKKKNMTFNEYKTFDKYGTQTFDLPIELSKILNQWTKLINKYNNENDYVIITKSQGSVDITKIFNEIFKPKKVSVNMLRHSYLTNFYSTQNKMPDLITMEELAKKLGHSLTQSLLYIRK